MTTYIAKLTDFFSNKNIINDDGFEGDLFENSPMEGVYYFSEPFKFASHRDVHCDGIPMKCGIVYDYFIGVGVYIVNKNLIENSIYYQPNEKYNQYLTRFLPFKHFAIIQTPEAEKEEIQRKFFKSCLGGFLFVDFYDKQYGDYKNQHVHVNYKELLKLSKFKLGRGVRQMIHNYATI